MPIELELVQSAVPDPWAGLVDPPTTPTATQQPASVLDAFDNLGQRAADTGRTGRGKTSALLELARALITRAELKPGDPIPVMFLLAPWAVDRPLLGRWLVDELVKRYRLPRAFSEAWVKSDRIIPLLDGLDEVPVEARAACVDAINFFQTNRQEGLSELAVTCRFDEYFALSKQLNLSAAVRLKPLTNDAIDAQLRSAGAQLEGVRQALESDASLREMASTPMVFDLLVRTYRGAGASSLPMSGGEPLSLEQLFGSYADLMLRRRSGSGHYSREQSISWLSWLANALARGSQTVLYIERLQPDYLTTIRGHVVYPVLTGWASVCCWECWKGRLLDCFCIRHGRWASDWLWLLLPVSRAARRKGIAPHGVSYPGLCSAAWPRVA